MATNYAKNLASGTLVESVSASTTTLLVYVGEGGDTTIKSVWPDAPFYATIMPENPSAGVANSLDSEIVEVTAVGTDGNGNTTLTVTRGQRDTTTKAFTAGAIVTNANYTEDAVFANIDPPDFFTNTEETVSGSGTEFTISPTLGFPLTSAELKGDTTQQTYTGKNLYKGARAFTVYNDNGITITNDGTGALTFNGTATASIYINIIDNTSSTTQANTKITVVGGKTYIASIAAPFTNNLTFRTNNLNYPVMQILAGNTASSSWTPANTEDNGLWCYVFIANGKKFENDVLKIQIEEASVATSYEPYVGGIPAPNPDYPQTVNTVTGEQTVTITDGGSQSQSYEVNLGKNLFDKSNISWYRNNNGAFSNTDDTSTTRIRTNSFPIVGGKTYTISGIPTDITLIGIRPFAVEGGSQTTAPVRDGNTFTFSDDTKYIHLLFGGENFSSATNIMMANADIQLELGSTATSYAPYFTPIELCKIGDYQDYIYKSGKDWYVHKVITKYVYSDSSQTAYFDSSIPRVSFSRPSNLAGGPGTAYCNQFIYGDSANTNNSFNYGASRIFMRSNEKMTSVTDWNSWMGQNPVIFYFALSTPTDTQITNTALIDQLNAMAATTYNGSTSFTVDGNGNLAAVLDATTARKNLAGLISVIKSCCE